MKLLEQFGIILTLTFIVETFKELVPLPVPASVYGLVLMLLLLKFKILNISAIKDASKLLIETMPIMFIPAAVGLLNAWNVIRDLLIPLTLVVSLTTVIVMVISGHITQFIIVSSKKKRSLLIRCYRILSLIQLYLV